MNKTIVKILCFLTALTATFTMSVGCSSVANEDSATLPTSSVKVPILMFHDVKTYEGGAWSISADNFRGIMEFILECGFTPVSFDSLTDYVDCKSTLPEKPVVITFDDGYFGVYRNVLPIITELNIPITVFMICETVRTPGVASACEADLPPLSAAELKIMNASPLVSVQSHSYALHGDNTSYGSTVRSSALPLNGESEQNYKKIFGEDCRRAEEVLSEIGVDKCTVFSYPNGKYSKWTEEVLHDRNYRVSVTSDENRVNKVTVGERESLFLLGRLNINDMTSKEALSEYLSR